jgi:hypothetical protein
MFALVIVVYLLPGYWRNRQQAANAEEYRLGRKRTR